MSIGTQQLFSVQAQALHVFLVPVRELDRRGRQKGTGGTWRHLTQYIMVCFVRVGLYGARTTRDEKASFSKNQLKFSYLLFFRLQRFFGFFPDCASRRAILRHLNFKKWSSEHAVFCACWFGKILEKCFAPQPRLISPSISRACIFFLLTLLSSDPTFFWLCFSAWLFIFPYCRNLDF